MTPISGTACLIERMARHTRFAGLTASLAASSRREGSVEGKTAIAGMPSARASSAALTARSTESRSTPGMEATGVRRPTPSIRKIGQMRSELASEVSRTRLRDQPARRFRRIRVAGKPGPFDCSDGERVRFARSFRNEMGLSFGAVICFSTARRSLFAANYHRAVPGANVSRPVWFAISTGLLAEVRLATLLHVEMEMILVRLVGVRTEHRTEMTACVLVQIGDEFGFGIRSRFRRGWRLRARLGLRGVSTALAIAALRLGGRSESRVVVKWVGIECRFRMRFGPRPDVVRIALATLGFGRRGGSRAIQAEWVGL